jgi:hypothetical protein
MSERPVNLPIACSAALKAIEGDPLNLPPADHAHIQSCLACTEARVLWLAQEEAPPALVAADYFERLPARILGKLPPARRTTSQRPKWLAAAAALMLITAGGGFWAGRINREPLVEASAIHTPADLKEIQPELPFHDKYEVIEQVQNLTPEEAETLLKQLEKQDSKTNP